VSTLRSIHESQEGAVVHIYVQPNASKTECAGPHGDAWKYRVAAPPLEGAANEELCRFLAKQFGLPRRHVEIRSGFEARRKQILLRNLSVSLVLQVLERQAASGTRA
jgi:uncharacterized protein (TIGR00251 family)